MERNKQERIKIFTDILGEICPDGFIERLDKEGYFEAPAGKKHHGAFEGGLFEHSVLVTSELVELTNKLGLKWERHEGPLVVGMFHDLCKVKQYITTKVPADENEMELGSDQYTGVCYEWNKKQNLPGHGEASIFRLMEYGGPQLKNDEMYCIRYHMEAYQGQQEWDPMDMAIKQYPNILYTHLADMIASKLKGA
jgi:3'-5' exoribonuclease